MQPQLNQPSHIELTPPQASVASYPLLGLFLPLPFETPTVAAGAWSRLADARLSQPRCAPTLLDLHCLLTT